ncbi:MAG: H/ACA ribonucleoprotein complex subunit GAR1 [Promethearchaeota archaeon]
MHNAIFSTRSKAVMNIGKILGKSHSNHLIIRASTWESDKKIPEIGEPVYTSEKKRIGNIADIFGPVTKPFVSVKMIRSLDSHNEDILNSRGMSLYTLPSSRKPQKKNYRSRPPKKKFSQKKIRNTNSKKN